MIYKLIGQAVVKLGWVFLRRKAAANRGLLLGAGAAAGLAMLAAAGYLVTRDTPEA